MKSKVLIFFLSILLVLTSTLTCFAENTNEQVITNPNNKAYDTLFNSRFYMANGNLIQFEQGTYWYYAGSMTYNRSVASLTIGALTGMLTGILTGGTATAAFVQSLFSSLLAAGLTAGESVDFYIKKTGFYKINGDGNGYPYYCHDIIETYIKENGKLKHVHTKSVYYYAYQYNQY